VSARRITILVSGDDEDVGPALLQDLAEDRVEPFTRPAPAGAAAIPTAASR
jgi:hypothetical protein